MRIIDTLVVHCSYTPPAMDVGAAEIDQWHRDAPKYWKKIGYHFVIRRDGSIESGRPVQEVGAHVRGHNLNSIGICLIGGMSATEVSAEFNFTPKQMATCRRLLNGLQLTYNVAIEKVLGHRDFSNVSKECPCFDVQSWYVYHVNPTE